MSRFFYLLRHGQAAPSHALGDFSRTLTLNGCYQAQLVAQFIKEKALPVSVIIHSDAVRTTQTAKIIYDELGFKEVRLLANHKLYYADLVLWLQQIAQLPTELNHVMFVGHNPSVTDLARYLLDDPNLSGFNPCSLFGFKLSSWLNHQQGAAELTLSLP